MTSFQYTNPPLHLPTVEEMNKLSTSQVFLLLLRIMETSDLSFTHHLFKHETIYDIEKRCAEILAIEQDGNCHHLSPTEMIEYTHRCSALYTATKERPRRSFSRG